MSPPTFRSRVSSEYHLATELWTDLPLSVKPLSHGTSFDFKLQVPEKLHLGSIQQEFWLMPGLFRPFAFPIASPPPPAPPKANTMLRDIVMAIKSMDLSLAGMKSNGGEAGCRYSEVVKIDDLASAKCNNKFQKDTKASARIEIRPLKDSKFSEIYRFQVEYDKAPGRTGIQVGGFYLSHPGNISDEGTLAVDREDPFESGKDFRKSVKERAAIPLSQSVEYFADPSKLLMRPQGWLYDSSPLADFDITKGVLMANGLIHENIYRDLNITPFRLPRRTDQFFDLFSKADGCYPKKPGAKVAQPNFIHDLPPLIEWAAPEKLELDLEFREQSISLGDFGSVTLGGARKNSIKVRGDLTETIVEIELGDISQLQLNRADLKIEGKGLKIGKITLKLPSIQDIAKEMGWLDRKKAEEVIQACLGNATPAVAKDRAAILQKLIRKLEISDVGATELSFSNASLGKSGTLKDAKIQSITLSDLKNIELNTIQAQSLSFEDTQSRAKILLKEPAIGKAKLSLIQASPTLSLESLKLAEMSVTRDETSLSMHQAQIAKMNLGLSSEGKFDFSLSEAKSQGTVDWKSADFQLGTKGSARIHRIGIQADIKDKSLSGFKADMVFSGKVDNFSMQQGKNDHLKLQETEFGESSLTLSGDFSGVSGKPRMTLDLLVDQAKLQGGRLSHLDFGASSLEKGKIHLEKTDAGLGLALQGKLDINILEIALPKIEFLTQGLRVKGTFQDIRIQGDGRMDWDHKEFRLTRDDGAKLGIKLKFKDLDIEDKPAERNAKLKGSLAGKVVESTLNINSASVEIMDLEKLHFIKGNKALGIKPELTYLAVSHFGIKDIQAGGNIWAKFPIFGWLLGKFPKIGRALSAQGELTSEIRFDSLSTRLESDGRYTELKNFFIQLFEVDGRKQSAKFKLPLLTMTPEKIESGKDPMELEVYFKDKDRGGDFKFELKDEDLEGRRRRRAP